MSRLRIPAAVLSVLSIGAVAASACTPDPNRSETDLVIVSTVPGNPYVQPFRAIVRDLNGSPGSGVAVTVDLLTASGNTGVGGALRCRTVQGDGTRVDCPSQTLSSVSLGDGMATFAPRFGGSERTPSIEVRANGVLLGWITARSTDFDADAGVGLPDLEFFRRDFFEQPQAEETDWDLDGITGLGDRNVFRWDFFHDTPSAPCGL